MDRDRLRKRVLTAVQVVVAGVLLMLVWRIADGADALRKVAQADPVWLVAALAALSAQTALSALRWRLTAAALGLRLDRGTALREYYLAQTVNQVVPGGVVGDAGRALRTRNSAGLMAASQAVVFERLVGQMALLVVLVLALVATALVPGGLDWPGGTGRMVAGLAAGAAALVIALWASPWLLPARATAVLERQRAAFVQAVAAPEVRLAQITLGLATVVCNVAAFGFCAWAVGADLPVAAAFALVPLILLTMILPVTIGGWGLREGAAAALFPLAGLSASAGLAASVTFGLMFLASMVPGIVWFGLGAARAQTKT